jgi:tetratricopeptide (TPR) repeat protein
MKTAEQFFQSAQSKWLRNDTEGAQADIEQALALDPDNPAYYLERANIRVAQRNYGQAIEDFDLAIEKNAEGAVLQSVLSQRSVYHEMVGRVNDLINGLSLIISHGFQYSNTYSWRANYYLKVGDSEKAIADYTSAYQLNPDNPTYLLKRAQAYFKIKRYHEAIKDLDALLLSGDFHYKLAAGIHLWRGKTHLKLNDTEKALADFNQIAKLYGSNITFVDPMDYLRLIETE